MNHPIDQFVANDGPTIAVLLAPVRCIDCEEYVPLGWVEYGIVVCPKNKDFGHRVSRDMPTHIKDVAFNRLNLGEKIEVADCNAH